MPRYDATECDDGTWMVHDDGDVIAIAGQGYSEAKAKYIRDALNAFNKSLTDNYPA